MSSSEKPSFFAGMIGMKCPNCRVGRIFVNKSIFPLGKCLQIKEQCSHCGLKMVTESNNGPGINYALTVMLLFLNLIWYVPIFGITYKDNSFYYFLLTSVSITILAQPFLMRISRVVYLYIAVRYTSRPFTKSSTEDI